MRPGLLLAGLLVLLCAWVFPLPSLDLPPFSRHMTMHMAVVALAAPLLALGLAGGRLDPVRRRPGPWMAIPASMLELIAVWAWHAPGLHHLARSTAWGLVLEQGTFLFTGMLLWGAALGGGPELRRARATGGVTGLLLTSMHMTLLGALLTLAQRPLYQHHHHGISPLSPLQDQQLGGAIMILAGGASYLFGGVWLVGEVIRDRRLATEGQP